MALVLKNKDVFAAALVIKDVDYVILMHLDYQSFMDMCNVSSYMKNICSDDHFLRQRIKYEQLLKVPIYGIIKSHQCGITKYGIVDYVDYSDKILSLLPKLTMVEYSRLVYYVKEYHKHYNPSANYFYDYMLEKMKYI